MLSQTVALRYADCLLVQKLGRPNAVALLIVRHLDEGLGARTARFLGVVDGRAVVEFVKQRSAARRSATGSAVCQCFGKDDGCSARGGDITHERSAKGEELFAVFTARKIRLWLPGTQANPPSASLMSVAR